MANLFQIGKIAPVRQRTAAQSIQYLLRRHHSWTQQNDTKRTRSVLLLNYDQDYATLESRIRIIKSDPAHENAFLAELRDIQDISSDSIERERRINLTILDLLDIAGERITVEEFANIAPVHFVPYNSFPEIGSLLASEMSCQNFATVYGGQFISVPFKTIKRRENHLLSLEEVSSRLPLDRRIGALLLETHKYLSNFRDDPFPYKPLLVCSNEHSPKTVPLIIPDTKTIGHHLGRSIDEAAEYITRSLMGKPKWLNCDLNITYHRLDNSLSYSLYVRDLDTVTLFMRNSPNQMPFIDEESAPYRSSLNQIANKSCGLLKYLKLFTITYNGNEMVRLDLSGAKVPSPFYFQDQIVEALAFAHNNPEYKISQKRHLSLVPLPVLRQEEG